MWKTILNYLIAFFVGVGSVLLIIARGKGNTTNIESGSIDSNNSRIRQGSVTVGNLIEREAERIKREQEQAKRDKGTIKDTRESISKIIRDAERDIDEKRLS